MERRPTTSHATHSDRARRLVRFLISLAFLLLGFLTVVLFLTTGNAIPENLTPWQELGCAGNLNQPGPIFHGITDCGCAYMTMEGAPGTAGFRVLFHDPLTGSLIEGSSASREVVSSSSKNNILVYDHPKATLVDGVKGKILTTFDKRGPVQFWANVQTNSVLFRSENEAQVWDMKSGAQLHSVSRPRMPRSFGFSDGAGKPKCVTVQPSGQLELWDESSGLRELVLKASKLPIPAGSTFNGMQAFIVSPDCERIAILDRGLVTIRSLTEDRIIRRLQTEHDLRSPLSFSGSALIRPGSDMRFSFDHRWIALEFRALNPVVATAQGVSLKLAQWLAQRVPSDGFVDLVDLETGQTWKSIPAGKGVAFSKDDSRLITFGEKGRYIWSLPPLLQPFTPWAWVALGAWLSLAILWWKMRRRLQSNVA